MLEDWTIYSWYCPNCKNEVAGLKNKNNQIRVKCDKCGAEMIRTLKGRRHDVIHIYAPDGEGRHGLELKRN
jgi:predicted nucleic acid-binding Zn ribbon protein